MPTVSSHPSRSPCLVSPDHSTCSAAAPPAQGTSPTPVPAAPKPARSTTPTAPPPTLPGYDYPDSDLQVVHNSLLRSIREANKQPAPRVDAARQIQWELPSIPAAIASTAGQSEAQDSSSALPPLPDHDHAGRAYLPPSALFGAMASSIVREWAHRLITGCFEPESNATTLSTHELCPTPDVLRPPVWYQTTPSAIRIPGNPPIYKYFRTGKWLNDQAIDAYLTLIHWRQSTFHQLDNGLVPVFIHSTQPSPFIAKRHATGLNQSPPMAKWFQRANLDPFDYQFHALPWNVDNRHWFAVIVDIPSKHIAILDSLSGLHARDAESIPAEQDVSGDPAALLARNVFQAVGTWLSELHLIFRGEALRPNEWDCLVPPVPQQKDSSSCGIFMLQHIEAICRIHDLGAVSRQPLISPNRPVMALELAQQRLLKRVPADKY
ncbi:hypothetical protein FFLO_06698 [Filobasidium floriforme]|uniref:Ubiquitin-like protease family profile domain-containing protein n=1 Tax=Filobasidium floriforme TaxID=5210 RepID=A0A8K0JEW7_9TREE|nr:hypothetical protein FFLO_06698 [Filobasidium floriforme]